MRHAHIFGTKGVYLIPSADCKKLDYHTQDCYFLCALPHGDGVRVLDASSKKIVKTRDAVFDENESQPAPIPHEPSIDGHHSLNPAWLYPNPDVGHTSEDPPVIQNQELAPAPEAEQRPRRQRQPPSRYGNIHAHSATAANSPTYKMAMNSSENDSWLSAMKLEIDSFIECKVYTLVPRPSNRKIISCQWHLKKKYNLDGTLKSSKRGW